MKFKKIKKAYFLQRLKQKHYPVLFRRMVFLWVFLIILEIGCPLFECQSFAAELPNDISKTSSAGILNADSQAEQKPQDGSITADEYQSITDHQSQDENCSGECLCHITPINVSAFIMPKDFQQSSLTPIKTKFQPSSDLPPPCQPPQFS